MSYCFCDIVDAAEFVNYQSPLVKPGKYDIDYVFLCRCDFRRHSRSSSEQRPRNRFNAATKLSRMKAGRKNSSLTPKQAAKPASSDACRLCSVNFKMSVGDFGGKNNYILLRFGRKSI